MCDPALQIDFIRTNIRRYDNRVRFIQDARFTKAELVDMLQTLEADTRGNKPVLVRRVAKLIP